MLRNRRPWWMYGAAAAYVAYFALLAGSAIYGPEEPGLTAAFDAGGMTVESVLPGSPAARAGLRPGDRVISAGGQPLSTRFDWMAVRANWRVAMPVALTIARGGGTVVLALTPHRRAGAEWASGAAVPAALLWVVRLAALALAIYMAFRRPDHAALRLGAWFLASASVALAVVLNGVAVSWRGLPRPLAACLWVPALSSLALPPIFLSFFAVFPRPAWRRAGWWWAVWAPAAFELGWFARYLYRMVYRPEAAAGSLPGWMAPLFAATSLSYLSAGIVLLWRAYRRSAEVNERRRLRLLAGAAAAGWAAVLPLVVFDWSGSAPSLAPGFFASPIPIAAALGFLAAMGALSYALLRRRVFGFRVMLRQGLRYALTRRLVLSLAPALAAVLLLDLLAHADQTLATILRARGWVYGLAAAAALLVHSRRQVWLEALDRRFFRERYDAQRLLREVVDEIQKVADFQAVAPRVVARVEAALHPEFAAVLGREPDQSGFRSLAAAPAGQAPPPLPAQSKLLALVRVLGKPLEISPSTTGWLREQLPEEDNELVRQAHIELLIPVAGGEGGAEALLALGPKRSEEPYTAEDRDLLSAVAGSLALLLRVRPLPGSRPEMRESFQECPQCGSCYDTGPLACDRDGAALARRALPRVLVDRYRLDRRLGQGGMGTVYEAADLALERRVAAKLLHDELVVSVEAAERFRREARAVAGFSHPHIVTVHDFGVVSGTCAFLVMELLEGHTLRHELRARARLAAARVLEIMRGVCEAVEAAHRRLLLHRDLKPENIFLARTEAGEISKVLDFGLAKPLRQAQATAASTRTLADTRSGVLIGTLQYMSPEQLLGDEPQPAWDLWALAVIAYEVWTGAHPFSAASRVEWRDAVLDARFERPSARLKAASPRADEFFDRALARNQARRPRSARELFSGLERAIS